MLQRLLLLICLGISPALSYAVELRVALNADPISLDPHEQLSEGGIQYSHAVFDPLVRWRQDGTFEPRLITSWEMKGANTVRLHVRHNVRFHSGNLLTADDILFTIKRLKRSLDFKALLDVVQDVDKIDDYTVDIHTKHASPLLLNILAYVFVMDEAFYKGRAEVVKYGQTFASTHVSGTGPFKVKNRKVGQALTLERYSDYWDRASKGNVDQLELLSIRSDSTRLAALLTADVEVISPVAAIDIARVKRTAGIKLLAQTGTRIVMLQMNQTRREEFTDVRVRRAMNLVINQGLIVEKILRGYGEPAGQLSAAGFMGHIKGLAPTEDIEQARALMKAAGYEEGFRVTMMAPNNRYMSDERVALAAAAMLAKINIQVDLKTFPKAQYFQYFDERAADIMMLGWQSDTFDSNNIFEFVLACTDVQTGLGAYNAGEVCDATIDGAIAAANQEMEVAKRKQLLQGIERRAAEQAWVIPLYWQPIIWAAKQNVELDGVVNFMNYPYWGDLRVDVP